MIWILVCLGVAIAAFAMWGDLNPKLPPGLRLPQGSALTAPPAKAPSPPAQPVISSSSWAITRDARNLRVSREFLTPIVSGPNRFYPPILHLSCYNAQLYAWLATGLQAKEDGRHPGTVAVRINGGAVQHWTKGGGQVIAATSPAALLYVLDERTKLSVTLGFEEAPEQTLELTTSGFDAFATTLRSCQ